MLRKENIILLLKRLYMSANACVVLIICILPVLANVVQAFCDRNGPILKFGSKGQ